jgi:hypothetical protein
MVEPADGSTSEREGTVRARGLSLTVARGVVLGGVAAALAAASWPAAASAALISARYQAIPCDTAPRSGSAPLPVGANTGLTATHLAFPASAGRFRLYENRSGISRYQLLKVISNGKQAVSRAIPITTVQSGIRTCVDNASQISKSSTGETAAITPADARRLFQLALALAFAYILFLAAWFWGTRERRSRVGSAARS